MADSSPVRVTFHGAAQTVTGSMHLVETGKLRILLDCGLYQGRRAEAQRRNSNLPFAPRDIDMVLLSHAHIDHCGNLPSLLRRGYAGPIYCTPATRDLLAIMLTDSARIQKEDAEYLNRKKGKGEQRIEPLYEQQDVVRTLRACQSIPYDRPVDLGRGLRVTFVEAGHLLGSAMIHLEIDRNGSSRSITFTGDVGRKALPILRDPAPVPPADLLISESTYGGRTHEPPELLEDNLADIIHRTVERGGKLLIPAFSLGRTQTIVYFFHRLLQAGKLPPKLPIFVDSPLASSATEVFRLHPECFDEETLDLLESEEDLFGGGPVRYVRSVDESKQLNTLPGPAIIMAASGMCEAGRILHHLKNHIEDPRTTVLIVGFQAPDTLGRRLVEKQPQVRLLDRTIQLRAEVVNLNGFSAHADHNDLLEFLGPLASQVKKTRLVHGEPEAADALAAALRERGFSDVAVPARGDSVDLD
ncbi:MAG: MBL fold metallo-hydrolase RNA specificity domain-containing protein [Gemmataceae bacterium]